MRYTVLIIVFALLTACGQKGPLYLPKDEPDIAGEIEVESGK